MKIRFNSKGKGGPTVHVQGIPLGVLSCIIADARKAIGEELDTHPEGGSADYNRYLLSIIFQMEAFLADTFPGKESEIET